MNDETPCSEPSASPGSASPGQFELRAEDLLEHSPTAFIVLDRDLRVAFAN